MLDVMMATLICSALILSQLLPGAVLTGHGRVWTHNFRPENVHPPAIPMSQFSRPSHRNPDRLREIKIIRHYTKHAEGSVLVEFGDTKVLCTASWSLIPRFLKGQPRLGDC